ncbi:putative disease resistance protein RGA1 [Gossypium hirsutum]|uniref:Disease resistance protein RGA1 n=1 Tax=Gossypium hirsutum TaxID=3635 RepID=A0ABM2Z639_GOSHI|nr:putative disease resistance protein RGA1 [Gossypium hirsutum]
MAEAIAFDIAGGLASKLSSLALSQIGLWWNFKDDIEDLKNTISTIKGVLLDAEEQSMTSNLVKNWLEKLKDALYDADDLLDDFSTEALRKDLLSGNKLTKEVRLFFSSSNQFVYGLKMGRQIKAIKARLTSIGSEAKMFNLVERDSLVEPSFMSKKRQRTHSFMHKDEIIGREDDKAALPKLMLGFQSEENVCIIPIVGFGGLGKTALAQFVYEIVKDHFEMRIWWEQWVSLKKLLMGGAKGSRIIVTTRSLRVAKITSKCQPHVLKGLSDDDAWSLFKEIAFEQRSTDSTSLEFVEIGKQILERCGGVPLVIRTIAGKLSFKNSKNDWLSFKDNELARISQNGGEILPTLKLSYDHLPYHLKHCFAYCRLYPKDHKIDVRTLVQFWIAQGFVKQSSPSQSLEEIGLGYFKDLVERSFFQEVEDDETWFTTCKMHDLMHDLAELVAGTESSFIDSNSSASELNNLNLNIVPRSIHKLKHLRYLDLSDNPNIKILPKSICNMQNLQALKLDWCVGLEELPKKIAKLVNLSHIGCVHCYGLTHMPRGIGKLTSLEMLSRFVVDKDGSQGGADLSELSGLINLKGELIISNLGFVKNAKEMFRAANLKEKQHLEAFVLEWGDDNNDDDKSLEVLQPHPNLKMLKVGGWRGNAKFPSWLSLLTKLVDITIWGPSNFKHLPSFAQLPCLQQLKISNLTELQCMEDHGPNGRHGDTESFFPSLKVLRLWNCPNMKSWWRTTQQL